MLDNGDLAALNDVQGHGDDQQGDGHDDTHQSASGGKTFFVTGKGIDGGTEKEDACRDQGNGNSNNKFHM